MLCFEKEKQPHYLPLSDLQEFDRHDLNSRTVFQFSLTELFKYIQAFAFIRGRMPPTYSKKNSPSPPSTSVNGTIY